MENFRLTVFRAVALHLNFRRAAEGLFLSQPAVTQQVKALEEELGVALFDRAGGRVALTAAGTALLGYAERLKATADEAVAALAELRGAHAGRLAVGASQTIAQYVLPGLLGGFLRAHPGVAVSTVSGNTDAMLAALSEGTVDLALVEGPGLRRDVVLTPFRKDRIVLVAPPGHALLAGEATATEVASAGLLVREQGSGTRRVVEQALADAGIAAKELRIAMTLDTTEGLLSAVEAGLGVTFVSRWVARDKLALGKVKRVRVQGLRIRRAFSIAYRSGPMPGGSAGAFLAFVLASDRQGSQEL